MLSQEPVNSVIKRAYGIGLVFVLALLFSVDGFAQVKAQLAWSDSSETLNNVWVRDWDGEQWSAAELVYQSENGLATPMMATANDGTSLLIWSEQQRAKSILMWAKKVPQSNAWSNASVFSRFGLENVAPTMVRDLSGQLWVFWSAQTGDYSDVYMRVQRAGSWSKPERIHAANKVPDIRPMASVNQLGEVQVRWSRYDFKQARYVEQVRSFAPATSEQAAKHPSADHAEEQPDIDPEQELDFNTVTLPISGNDRFFGSLHAPANRFVQSVRVEPR